MDLQLQPQAHACCATGAPFQAGDRVVSVLAREADGYRRFDFLAAEEARADLAGEELCRWTRTFKPPAPEANPERELKLTAESLFLSLTEEGSVPEENAALKQFLALMLERKRVLKNRGTTAEGRTIFEHMPSHRRVEVPRGELDAAFFLHVREKLGALLGEPGGSPAPSGQPGVGGQPEQQGAGQG